MDHSALLDSLPPERRLALAYAPRHARGAFLAVLALDQKLARIVGQGSEPLIGQMRMAWWRERLAEPAHSNPKGEPILTLLAQSGLDRPGLIQLVDAWEVLLGDRFDAQTIDTHADGRSGAFGGLAAALGFGTIPSDAVRMARNWVLADLASKLSDPGEVELVRNVLSQQDWRASTLPKALRPLAVLHGLARRKQGQGPLLANWVDGICAVRLGMFGR